MEPGQYLPALSLKTPRMPHYKLTVHPTENDDGEELGYFDFDLLDLSVVRMPWYDGVLLDSSLTSPIALRPNDMGGWCTAYADYCSTPVPLASARLRDAFESAGVSNVEWFPTEVLGTSHECPIYFAMNIVGSVAAVDTSRSPAHRLVDAPGADIFDRLVLDESRVAGLPLFRLAESVTTIIASDSVRRAVEAAGIETVAFTPV